MPKLHSNKDIKQNTTMPYPVAPFISIGHQLDDEVKKTVIELLYLIREHGIKQLIPDLTKPEEICTLAELVHDGWKKAHLIIAEELTKRLSRSDNLKKRRKKRYESENEKREVEGGYHKNRIEIIVLRRMLDSIAWTMLKKEHSTIRRLQVPDSASNLSIRNIEDALPTASLWNEDSFTIAICSDMTTFVHIGDLLVYKYIEDRVFFAELKSGKKNMLLADAAHFSITENCDNFEGFLSENLEQTDLKHYNRIKRQLTRGNEVISTLNNEKGYDSHLNRDIKIHPVEIPVERYSDAIVNCCNEITDKKTWSISTVDDCLHIGVYSDCQQGYVAFNGWMEIIKCRSRVYNITDSFSLITALPFASLDLPTEILEKILKGTLIIVMCFDTGEFLRAANDKFPNFLKLGNSKKSRRDSQIADLLMHDGQFIESDSGGVLGSGFIDRIIFDLQSPLNALTMIYQMEKKGKI